MLDDLSSNPTVGTCLSWCPEQERLQREQQHGGLDIFEKVLIYSILIILLFSFI
jgi:hypothetical protein